MPEQADSKFTDAEVKEISDICEKTHCGNCPFKKFASPEGCHVGTNKMTDLQVREVRELLALERKNAS
jgi:hypothetical protein